MPDMYVLPEVTDTHPAWVSISEGHGNYARHSGAENPWDTTQSGSMRKPPRTRSACFRPASTNRPDHSQVLGTGRVLTGQEVLRG